MSNLEDFGSLIKDVEEASKKKGPRRSSPVGRSSKDRLAEYNRLMTKRRRRQEIHDSVIDVIIILSFVMIAYIAFCAR